MTRLRPFRNSDPPALTRLWNQAVPDTSTAHPLHVHELDVHAWGRVIFEADGLIVAERDGQAVGFVHAGFGPEVPLSSTRPLELDREIGTIAMLIIAPELHNSDLGLELIAAGEAYLRSRGARVLYAGGLLPLNPFYWGIHGGSEGSGILSAHAVFHLAVAACGYAPIGTTVLLRANLSAPEPRDPRTPVIRRMTQLEFLEDMVPTHWWQNLAIGDFPMTAARLLSRSEGAELARAGIWEMRWFGRDTNRAHVGLVDLHVAAEHRRKGYGRFLVGEILRRARTNLVDCIDVQTSAENEPALALYASLGFSPVDQSILYRKKFIGH
ncbi:MAG: GNAT family N-acetyltransferase [Isosphaeraceae bacterium]